MGLTNVLSFSDLIKKDHYLEGVRTFYTRMESKELYKTLLSPYEPGSKESEMWFDGYKDAFFVHYGVTPC